MRIVFSATNTSYACARLASALQENVKPLKAAIVARYASREDQRVLAVLFSCPCCSRRDLEIESADLIVSAFSGVDPAGLKIDGATRFYPPHRTPGEYGEAKTDEEYRESVLWEIDRVLR